MQNSAQMIWTAAQKQLSAMLNPEQYNLWFAPIRALELSGESILLEVTNEFHAIWLKENHQALLREVIATVSGRQLEIKFQGAAEDRTEPDGTHHQPQPVRSLEPQQERKGLLAEQGFNPKNTFETFVVGSNNQFAHAAAIAVAQAPGKSYNPLFFYGGVGLGKTHLLHAIGQYVAGHKKGARVAYVTCEKFTNEYIDAIQNNLLVRFRKKYRQTDVLLIDDIQFLAGKERIQEEFFHTFNALHDAHKQIVLSCDRPASEIQGLEQRLVSRFEWGLVTDMQPPDIEIRVAILRKKAEILRVSIPEDIVQFLANRIRTNIRRLEGALIRVASYASLTGKALSREVVEGLLREVLHEEGRCTVSIDSIQKKVAEHFDIRVADMTSKRRPENIAFPRQIAMYLSRLLTENSLSSIGEAFGGRDHGTVLHACKQVTNRMEVDSSVRQVVNFLEKHLQR